MEGLGARARPGPDAARGPSWGARIRRAWGMFCPALWDVEPGTREALETHTRELTARNLALTGWIVGVLTIAAWPTDFLLYAPGSPELEMLQRWRIMLLGATSGLVLLMRLAAWARRHAFLVAQVVYAIAMGSSAWLNAGLGDMRSPFFYGVYTAPLMTVLLVVGPLRRALSISVVVGTYLGVFFTQRPEALEDPLVGAVFVWLGASAVTAQVAGNALYHLLGVRFLQRRELDLRQAELMELDRLRRAFFANVSHELRTPLTNILGALRGLEGDADPREVADVGLRNATRLRALVDDLLSLARFDRAAPRPERRLVDVSALARAVLAEFRYDGGHTLELEVQGPVLARVDPQQVRTALTNLVGNAVKFSAPRDGPVAVRVRAVEDEVEIQVRDHGVGIEADELEHLFDRFYRGAGQRAGGVGGAGIGLALVREITDAHGGQVHVQSEPGHGATFTMRLPRGATPTEEELAAGVWTPEDTARPTSRRAARPRESSREEAAHGVQAERALVLVAEDDADLRAYLIRTLSRRFRVLGARDGFEALDRARNLHPEAIVSDLRMPRVGGEELLRSVRGDRVLRDTPVLFLTAHAGPKGAPESLAAGADEFLVKPFDEDELLERVGLLVARSARRRELEARVREATEAVRRSARNLVAVQEEERQRLARDLHDQAGPILLGLRVELEHLRASDAEGVARMEGLLSDLQVYFRATLSALRPPGLDERGVFSALRAWAKEVKGRHGLPCEVVFHVDEEELSDAQALAVYRIGREALTNVARHARATRAVISLEEDARPGWWLLRVRDDGVGPPPSEPADGGMGLLGMRERAHLLGGALEIRPAKPRGTELLVRFPLAGDTAPSAGPAAPPPATRPWAPGESP